MLRFVFYMKFIFQLKFFIYSRLICKSVFVRQSHMCLCLIKVNRVRLSYCPIRGVNRHNQSSGSQPFVVQPPTPVQEMKRNRKRLGGSRHRRERNIGRYGKEKG